MKTKGNKRFLALFLCLSMIFSLGNFPVLAVETENTNSPTITVTDAHDIDGKTGSTFTTDVTLTNIPDGGFNAISFYILYDTEKMSLDTDGIDFSDGILRSLTVNADSRFDNQKCAYVTGASATPITQEGKLLSLHFTLLRDFNNGETAKVKIEPKRFGLAGTDSNITLYDLTSLPGEVTFTKEEVSSVSVVLSGPEDAQLPKGATMLLSAAVTPKEGVNPADYAIVWKSSDTNVAEVDSYGVVTGISAGSAVITATAMLPDQPAGAGEGTYSLSVTEGTSDAPMITVTNTTASGQKGEKAIVEAQISSNTGGLTSFTLLVLYDRTKLSLTQNDVTSSKFGPQVNPACDYYQNNQTYTCIAGAAAEAVRGDSTLFHMAFTVLEDISETMELPVQIVCVKFSNVATSPETVYAPVCVPGVITLTKEDTPPVPPAPTESATIAVKSNSNISGKAGTIFTTDVELTDIPKDGFNAMSFTITYDTEKLKLDEISFDGGIMPSLIANTDYNYNDQKCAYVSGASATPITEGGTLLSLTFSLLKDLDNGETATVSIVPNKFGLTGTNATITSYELTPVPGEFAFTKEDVSTESATITVKSVSDINGKIGTTFTTDVELTDIPKNGFNAMSFAITYDTEKLKLDEISFDDSIMPSLIANTDYNYNDQKCAYVSGASATPITEGGTLLSLTFSLLKDLDNGETATVSIIPNKFGLTGTNATITSYELTPVPGEFAFTKEDVSKKSATITVKSVSDINGKIGTTFTTDVELTDIPKNGFNAISFTITYDTEKLRLDKITPNFSYPLNLTINPDRAYVTGASATPITEGGTLLSLTFSLLKDLNNGETATVSIEPNKFGLTGTDATITSYKLTPASGEFKFTREDTDIPIVSIDGRPTITVKSVDNIDGKAGTTFTADVELTDIPEAGFDNMQFDIIYDTERMKLDKIDFTDGIMPYSWTVNIDTAQVAGAWAKPIKIEDGKLLSLEFTLLEDFKDGETTNVSIEFETFQAVIDNLDDYSRTVYKYHPNLLPGEFTFIKMVPTDSVALDKNELTLTEGNSGNLTATIFPANATNKAVTWESSDENIATVQDGLVTAVSEGTATITVTTNDNGKTASCKVTVTSLKAKGITIAAKPNQVTYSVNEPFKPDGLSITVLYGDGTTETIAYSEDGLISCSCDTSIAGRRTVTVIYQGLTASFSIDVVAGSSSEPSEEETVSAPRISIETFIGGKNIRLATDTEGAEIYYTTGNGTPDILYNTPIEMRETTTIRAIAKKGKASSKVTGSTISVDTVKAPEFSHAAEVLTAGTIVTLASDRGAMIYYTLDGSEPTTDGTTPAPHSIKYENGIYVTRTMTLKAIAVKQGYRSSKVVTKEYRVKTDKISISVGSATAKAGTAKEIVSIPIYFFMDKELKECSFTLTYNKAVLKYDSKQGEDVLVDEGEKNGKVKVKVEPAEDPIRSGEVCTLNFEVLASAEDGEYNLDVIDYSAIGMPIVAGTPGEEYGNKDFEITPGKITLKGSHNTLIKADTVLLDADGNKITDSSSLPNNVTANASFTCDAETSAGIKQLTIILALYSPSGQLLRFDTTALESADLQTVFTQAINTKGLTIGSIKMIVVSKLADMTPISAASELL